MWKDKIDSHSLHFSGDKRTEPTQLGPDAFIKLKSTMTLRPGSYMYKVIEFLEQLKVPSLILAKHTKHGLSWKD